MNVFSPADPDCPLNGDGKLELWHFVYLHGQAEDVVRELQEANGWRWESPDLCVLDGPHSTKPGAYPVTVYGRPAIAVLANQFGLLGGRVALLTDPDALAHVIDPAAWM